MKVSHVRERVLHDASQAIHGQVARDALDLEYYWGRVEFASGRGAIHLHILGIGKEQGLLE